MLAAIIFTNLLVGSKNASRTPLLEGYGHKNDKDEESDKEAEEAEEDTDKGADEGKTKNVDETLITLKPAPINKKDTGSDLDFPGSLEAAYDNLDKLLSSDAINKMSADTQKLAEKQHKLMKNIGKLEPLMENAQNMMEGLNGGKVEQLMEKYMNKV